MRSEASRGSGSHTSSQHRGGKQEFDPRVRTIYINGAPGRTRTDRCLQAPDPRSGVSTVSTTGARMGSYPPIPFLMWSPIRAARRTGWLDPFTPRKVVLRRFYLPHLLPVYSS